MGTFLVAHRVHPSARLSGAAKRNKKTDMAKRWIEKVEQLMPLRIVVAQKQLRKVISEGEKYWRYIYGDPPEADSGDTRIDYLRRYSRDPDDEKMRQGWDTTVVPMHSILRGALIPYLLGGDSSWFNRRRDSADLIEAAKAELAAMIAQSAWSRCGAQAELERAADDAFCYGVGWLETDLDDRIDWPRHLWRDARDILVDCETRSPRHEDKRWMGVKTLLPIETAKWMAKERWDNSKYEFTPVRFDPDMDDTDGGGEVVPGARSSDTGPSEDSPTDFVRIVRIFVKGENPHTESARVGSKAMADPAGHDAVYDGKDHVLIVEAGGGYNNAGGYKVIGRIDWPFPCDPGETPLTPVKLTKDNRNFYPYPITQPAHPLQAATNASVQAYYTDMRNSSRRVVGIQPEAFQDEAQAEAAAYSDAALVTTLLKKGHTIEQAMQVKNFGSPNSSLNLGQEMGRDLYRLISGLQSFEVEVRANQTAFNTSVQNEQSQLKLDSLAKQIEWSATMCQRKALMCAKANLNYEEIKRWVNPPVERDGEQFEQEEITTAGDVIVRSKLWPTKPDWQDIRDEVEIDLEPRSMRFKNPDKEAGDIKEIAEYQTQMVRIIGDISKGGNVWVAQAIARVMNATVKATCKLKNIMNWEDYVIDPEAIGPPQAPPLDPNQVMQAQTQAQTQREGINAQQQGAMTKLMMQGADPNAMPEMG